MLNVELCPSNFEENLDINDFSSFSEFVEETALQKVLEVRNRLNNLALISNKPKPDIIIGADTMIGIDGEYIYNLLTIRISTCIKLILILQTKKNISR